MMSKFRGGGGGGTNVLHITMIDVPSVFQGSKTGLHACHTSSLYTKSLTDTHKTVQPAENPDRNLPVNSITRNPLVGRRLLTDSAIQPIRPGIVLSMSAGLRPNLSKRGHATGAPNRAPRGPNAWNM